MPDTFVVARQALSDSIKVIDTQRQEHIKELDVLNDQLTQLQSALEALGGKTSAIPARETSIGFTKPVVASRTIGKHTARNRYKQVARVEDLTAPYQPVVKAIRDAGGPISGSEIRMRTKVPSSMVTYATKQLLGLGLIEQDGTRKSRQGPPTKVWKWTGGVKRETVVEAGVGVREGRVALTNSAGTLKVGA